MFKQTIDYLHTLVENGKFPELTDAEKEAIERRQENHLRYNYPIVMLYLFVLLREGIVIWKEPAGPINGNGKLILYVRKT